MRVESDRPSRNSMGGWLHKIGEATIQRFVPHKVETKPQIDFHSIWKRWLDSTEHHHLDRFAMSLGVETDCLKSLGCAWSGKAWAFPMRDASKNIIGIRMRSETGKWAVEGSRNGLFIPDRPVRGETLWIVEGPTDAAAGLTIGLSVVGRPSCSARDEMVKAYLIREGITRAVIITDNDRPDERGVIAGIRGAEKLQKVLPIITCTWIPPTKDLRAFVNAGGTRQILESTLKDLVWERAA